MTVLTLIIITALTYLLLCVLVGAFARGHRNRSGFLWFLLSWGFTPILAFLAVAVSKPHLGSNTWFNQPVTLIFAVAAWAFYIVMMFMA